MANLSNIIDPSAPPNPKPFRIEESGAYGFDDNGERVPLTWPDDDGQEPPQLTADLTQGIVDFLERAASREERGDRVTLLAHMLKTPGAARTRRELASRLCCSHPTAGARLTKFRREIKREFGNFRR